MKTIRETLQEAAELLRRRGVDSAGTEAALLLSHASGMPREKILLEDGEMPEDLRRRFDELVARRAIRREPFAYIVGTAGFHGTELHVDPTVLIPRPSTESLVERALSIPGRIAADIGAGCGAVAVVLALKRPEIHVIATDISEEALSVARKNAERHGVAGRIDFRRGSLHEPLDERVDLLVSNPPYIRSEEIGKLAPEIRHEPAAALDGGPDGLGFIRPLIEGAADRLAHGGSLIMEFGYGQAGAVRAAARDAGFRKIAVHKDLDGIDRILEASLSGRCGSASPRQV